MSLFNMFEEELAEFGTVEEKRRYIAEQRLANPNWVNTIFRPGKTQRGEGWTQDARGSFKNTIGHGGRQKASASRPGRSRKARAH